MDEDRYNEERGKEELSCEEVGSDVEHHPDEIECPPAAIVEEKVPDPVVADPVAIIAEPVLVPVPVVDDAQEIGLKDFSKALSNRSSCYLCNVNIGKGDWRYTYRFFRSTSLRHQRYIHAACVTAIPEPMKPGAIRQLERWQELADRTVEEYAFFDAQVEVLRGPTGALPSGV